MAVPLLDLDAQHRALGEEIDAALAEVIASNQFILGPAVERFEAAVAEFVGVRHAVGCASGTDALLLALRGLGLSAGDEVLVPAFTFFATAGAVWNAGLRPVFCDVDPRTFNVTAETLRPHLTQRTRAIIVVHLFGQMAEMDPILELAEAHGLVVIEDAAQAFGARQRVGAEPARRATERRPSAGEWTVAGSVGTAGALSFFPTKNLGGIGDAGMIVTDDAALADRVRKLRVHGGRQMYHHEMVGTNSRLDTIHAAVLEAKLPHVPHWLELRRAAAAAYDEAFGGIASDLLSPHAPNGNEHSYNQYTVRARDRDALRESLGRRDIGTGVYYPVPLHLQACFAALGYRAGDLPESERACAEVLSLPVFPGITAGQIEEVVTAVREFYG